ncbi:hypothetical protein Thimo_2941 [Thioflavicoccus mobilis 8321]|uniref:Uncharacterized protein n=1 Tax=Thioflavicoccus mobilis 8321 TaxID=765912 RepID=L0GY00_9GAMM|nr:hypothetical protein Thimo_2941 [Thioflavicoccus mobilis 8321]
MVDLCPCASRPLGWPATTAAEAPAPLHRVRFGLGCARLDSRHLEPRPGNWNRKGAKDRVEPEAKIGRVSRSRLREPRTLLADQLLQALTRLLGRGGVGSNVLPGIVLLGEAPARSIIPTDRGSRGNPAGVGHSPSPRRRCRPPGRPDQRSARKSKTRFPTFLVSNRLSRLHTAGLLPRTESAEYMSASLTRHFEHENEGRGRKGGKDGKRRSHVPKAGAGHGDMPHR